MPVIKSAIKKARQDVRARKRNRAIRDSFRDAVKDVKKLAVAGDAKKLEEALKKAYSEIDKAAKRGVIHKNTAARRKSRLIAFVKNPKVTKKSESKKTVKREATIVEKSDSKKATADKEKKTEEKK